MKSKNPDENTLTHHIYSDKNWFNNIEIWHSLYDKIMDRYFGAIVGRNKHRKLNIALNKMDVISQATSPQIIKEKVYCHTNCNYERYG